MVAMATLADPRIESWISSTIILLLIEILEYCKILGLDPIAEKDFLFIAKEGIKAPLPKEWKPV